jgi:hypothetical protein
VERGLPAGENRKEDRLFFPSRVKSWGNLSIELRVLVIW